MLIKPGSKRRRTQTDIAAARDAQELRDQIERENEERIRELTEQVNEMREESQQNIEYKNVVGEMLS